MGEIKRCMITNIRKDFLKRDYNAVLWYWSEYFGGVPVGSVIDPEAMTMDMLGWHIEFRIVGPIRQRTIKLAEGQEPLDFTVPYLAAIERVCPELNEVTHDIPSFFTMICGTMWWPLKALDYRRFSKERRRRGEEKMPFYNPVWDCLKQLRSIQDEIKDTERRLQRVRETFGLRGVSYDGIRTSPTNDVKSPAEAGALRSLGVQEELEELYAKQQEAQAWMVRWIMEVDHVTARRGLMLYFYDGLTWDDAALEMGGRIRSGSLRDICKRWVNNYFREHPDFEPPGYVKELIENQKTGRIDRN